MRFMSNYSQEASPLTCLTSANSPFWWSLEATAAFTRLKTLFTASSRSVPPIRGRSGCSDSGAGAVLSQQDPSTQVLHPCAFFSCCLSPAEWNYDVGNRVAGCGLGPVRKEALAGGLPASIHHLDRPQKSHLSAFCLSPQLLTSSLGAL